MKRILILLFFCNVIFLSSEAQLKIPSKDKLTNDSSALALQLFNNISEDLNFGGIEKVKSTLAQILQISMGLPESAKDKFSLLGTKELIEEAYRKHDFQLAEVLIEFDINIIRSMSLHLRSPYLDLPYSLHKELSHFYKTNFHLIPELRMAGLRKTILDCYANNCKEQSILQGKLASNMGVLRGCRDLSWLELAEHEFALKKYDSAVYYANIYIEEIMAKHLFLCSPSDPQEISHLSTLAFELQSQNRYLNLLDYLALPNSQQIEAQKKYVIQQNFPREYDSINLLNQELITIVLKNALLADKGFDDNDHFYEQGYQMGPFEQRLDSLLEKKFKVAIFEQWESNKKAIREELRSAECVLFELYTKRNLNKKMAFGDLDSSVLAIITQQNKEAPYKLVHICSLADLTNNGSNLIANQLSRKAITRGSILLHENKEISSDLSLLNNLFWKPLLPHLRLLEIKFYLKGFFAKLPILAAGCENEVFQKYKVVQKYSYVDNKTNTRSIHPTDIVLVGGLDFGNFLDNSNGEPRYVQSYSDLSNEGVQYDYASSEVPTASELVKLPATLKEINEIKKLALKTNLIVTILSDSMATEQNVYKALEKVKNPCILHIASHGFHLKTKFIGTAFDTTITETPENAELKMIVTAREQVKLDSKGNRYENLKDPMLRNGIALSFANKSWTSTDFEKASNDNFLLPSEVAALDLRNVSLVVLSACETGLGDIDEDTGELFGLQRAFKMAGVKNLLLTLWSVDDEKTKEFMVLFYSKLFETNEINASFRYGQLTMKSKYKDPYYWAGFILVE